jgi:hypothetical protein
MSMRTGSCPVLVNGQLGSAHWAIADDGFYTIIIRNGCGEGVDYREFHGDRHVTIKEVESDCRTVAGSIPGR